MDLITHFIVPYAILTLLKSKNRLEGALGGISLDFDVLLVWVGILFPEFFIFTHRGITHSLFFGFFTSVIFLYIVTRQPVKETINKIIHRNLKIEFNKVTVLIAFFGALTHLFLDYLTSLGIPLFYPFSLTRYSAELYYYLDTVTTIIAFAVLLIIYLKINTKYKKIALTAFIAMLIIFGGIRGYEKMNTLQQSSSIDGNYTYITAYPTQNMFVWSVVKSNDFNTSYSVFQYNTLNNSAFNFNKFESLSVTNGTYISALNAINKANNLPEVQKFKWSSYYTCINAEYSSNWTLNYFDILNSSYGSRNLTVEIQ
jgi:inner membrane protein